MNGTKTDSLRVLPYSDPCRKFEFRINARPHPGPLAVELRKSASETEVVFSLSSDEGGGEGWGEELGFIGFPLSQPSPRSFLAGRGSASAQCIRALIQRQCTPTLSQESQERVRRRPTLHTLRISVAVGATLRFVSEAVRPSNTFIMATRGRTIRPLLRALRERAGVRASVSFRCTLSA